MSTVSMKLQSWTGSFKRFLLKTKSKISPKVSEVLAGAFIVLSAILIYIYGVFTIIPEVLQGVSNVLVMLFQIACTWILIGVLSNFFLIRKRSSSIKNRMLIQPVVQPMSSSTIDEMNPEVQVREATKHMGEHFTATPFGDAQNWHICAVCEVFVPPRTWHCHNCNTCILRRDHHCIFTGCCIGEENQSNFIGLVFYLGLGSSVAAVVSLIYYLKFKQFSFLFYIFRSVVLIYTFFFDFDIKLILSSISTVGLFVSWGVFGYYFYNALKGQTSADAHRKRYFTVPGCKRVSFDNMREFLGPNPAFRILWPFHHPLKINYSGSPQYKFEEDEQKGL